MDMGRGPDVDVAERMLSGSVGPEAVPPAYRSVAALLEATRGPQVGWETSREGHTVALMLAEIRAGAAVAERVSSPTRGIVRAPSRPRRRFLKTKLVAAMAALMLVSGASLAFAGALPPSMQSTAAHLFRIVGIHVPDPAVRPIDPTVSPPRPTPADRDKDRPSVTAPPTVPPPPAPKDPDGGTGVSGDQGDQDGTGTGGSGGQGDQNGQSPTVDQNGSGSTDPSDGAQGTQSPVSGQGSGGTDPSGEIQGSQTG